MTAVFKIKENSFIARMASFKLRSQSAAIVIGRTIHLYNITSEDFLKNSRWLNHELCHIRQFKEYGFLPFILKYVWESIRHGYKQNKFEIEARDSENR